MRSNAMKRLFALCLVALISFGAAMAQDTLRVLCIGNSFSEDAVEHYLVELGADRGVTLIVGNLYIGGCSLERHAQNVREDKHDYRYRLMDASGTKERPHTSIHEALAFQSWDVVTMQQASHFSGQWRTYEPYLKELVDSVRLHVRKDTRLLWHMTWAYSQDSKHDGFKNYGNSQQQMHDSICACVERVMQTGYFDAYIPGGHAIYYARRTKLGDTLCRDGYHMQIPYGRYCLACTWLEALTGKNPVRCKYHPEGVSKQQFRLTKQSAHRAARHARTRARDKK